MKPSLVFAFRSRFETKVRSIPTGIVSGSRGRGVKIDPVIPPPCRPSIHTIPYFHFQRTVLHHSIVNPYCIPGEIYEETLSIITLITLSFPCRTSSNASSACSSLYRSVTSRLKSNFPTRNQIHSCGIAPNGIPYRSSNVQVPDTSSSNREDHVLPRVSFSLSR